MKRKLISLITTFAVILTVIAFPMSANAANYGSDAIENYALQVAAIVNSERAANGLAPLKYSDKLSEAAIVRAAEIQTYFSHTRPNGTSCFTAMTEAGIKYRAAGENIAYGQRNPQEVMNGWMNSSGHRANILSSNYEYIGIGVTYKNGVYYWSQFFAASDDLTGYVVTFEEEKAPETTTAPVTTKAPAATTVQTTAAPRQTTVRTTAAPRRTTAVTTAAPPVSSVQTTAYQETKTTEAAVTTKAQCYNSEMRNEIIRLIMERFRIDISKLLSASR